MSYSDVINAINLHGGALNKTAYDFSNVGNRLSYTAPQSGGVNPLSSEAYTPTTYRDIRGGYADVQNPIQMYADMGKDLSKWDKTLLKGAKGFQALKFGQEASPYIQDFGAGVYNALTKKKLTADFLKDAKFNLGPAAAVYGAFGSDQDPYTFTRQEGLGTTLSTMMGAHQLSKLIPAAKAGSGLFLNTAAKAGGINPYVLAGSFLLSKLFNKGRKKKALRMRKKAVKNVNEQVTEAYEERSDKLQDMRDDMLAQQTAQMYLQDAGRYSNQYGGNYSSRLQADKGMKFTPKELNKIAKAGRNGDTMLAHVNPQEAALLKALGGSGTTNPYTGMPEYGYGSTVSNFFDGVTDAFSTVADPIVDVLDPVFDAAGDVVDPIASNVVAPTVSAFGDLATTTIDKSLDTAIDVTKTGLDAAADVGGVAADIVTPVVKPVFDKAMDITKPVMEGIADVVEPFAGMAVDIFGNVIDTTLALPGAAGDLISGLLGGGDVKSIPGSIAQTDTTKRSELTKLKQGSEVADVQLTGPALSKLKKTQKDSYVPGDWVSSKENPFISPNVEEEIDYAAYGMKFKDGGKPDIVAEFTGNELIVNNQDKVEKGLSTGNYAMAAAPIRNAMKKNQLTPGPETHAGNPLPVDSKGNIYYYGGGKLKFKVKKGAGVYDHATDQFKPTMTDKEIAMVASNNIAKWERNGMA